MTAVYDPAINRNFYDTYYSRMMWVKTPTEILAKPTDKPGLERT
jgi:hypothetical protein